MRLGHARGRHVRGPGLAGAVVALVAAPLFPASVSASVSAAASVVGAPAPVGEQCLNVGATTEERSVKGDNAASLSLHVAQAQALVRKSGAQPGAGVTVVVVDSGIEGYRDEAPRPVELPSGHGIAVAGVIAGPDQTKPTRAEVGIAPGADVRDARFYDVAVRSQDGQLLPSSAALAAKLGEVAAAREAGSLGRNVVVVVPTQVPRSADLEAQVGRLVRAGVLVVAASGDRPADDGTFPDGYEGQPKKGEDVAGVVWPAAHPGVLAAGVSTPNSSGTVLRSSDIDLAAPGDGAVSKGRNGGWCVLTPASTAWAAAQVAGVAALVWSAHPDETAVQLRNRLEQTASGNGGPSSPITGYGVVQPVEAIQRDIAEMGARRQQQVEPARPPRAQADVLAGARHDAVWWGLGGGAALVVLLLLRPLLSRRR